MIPRIAPMTMADRKAVIDIFNHYIESSFAAFPDHPLPYEAFDAILHKCHGYPMVTALNDEEIIGFGLLHPYNPFPVFSNTAEVTYFIKPEWTGKGVGTKMLAALILKAVERGITNLLASISSLNIASLNFHQKQGFCQCGCFHHVGRKRDIAFDIIYMQKFLR